MASFYLVPYSNRRLLYELSATTDVQVAYTSEVTSYRVDSGMQVSDNVFMNPVEVTFTGVISDIQTTAVDKPLPVREYLEGLKRLQRNKEVFSVGFSGNAVNGVSGLRYAVITELSISKDETLGSSWGVTITMKELRSAALASITLKPWVEFSHLLEGNSDADGNTASASKQPTDWICNDSFCTRRYTRASGETGSQKEYQPLTQEQLDSMPLPADAKGGVGTPKESGKDKPKPKTGEL